MNAVFVKAGAENKISKPSTYHSSSKTSNFLEFHQGVAPVIELKIDRNIILARSKYFNFRPWIHGDFKSEKPSSIK